jgi:hypothetical protein
MTYSLVSSYGTEYAVDWDIVERLCMSYWQTHYQLRHSETTETSERTWNPFSWAMPTIKTIDVKWDKVREDAHIACIKDMFDYSQRAPKDMRGVALDVRWKVVNTASNKRMFTNDLKGVQAANVAAMQDAESDYAGLIDAARFVRDTSADVVAIGSTIATGGAAAGLLGASSALKGAYKYQDTGSAGAAVLYGGGSLLVGYFKIGGKEVGKAGEVVLIIAQGAIETGTSLVAGDSFSKAAERGALKIASTGAAHALFSAPIVKEAFSRIPIPFNVFAKTPEAPVGGMIDVANKLLEKTGKKLTEKGVKAGISAVGGDSSSLGPNTTSSGIVDEAPVENLGLLDFAIVNMKKGIGHGW